MGKNQAKAKQHTEAEHLLLENYVLSSSTLSSKDNRKYFLKCAKDKYGYLNEVICYMINGNENDAENEKRIK